jgi:hypothetical protein
VAGTLREAAKKKPFGSMGRELKDTVKPTDFLRAHTKATTTVRADTLRELQRRRALTARPPEAGVTERIYCQRSQQAQASHHVSTSIVLPARPSCRTSLQPNHTAGRRRRASPRCPRAPRRPCAACVPARTSWSPTRWTPC